MSDGTLLAIETLGRCGSCRGKLGATYGFVELGRRATWEYPSATNMLTGYGPEAIGLICEPCVQRYRTPTEAIELRTDRGRRRFATVPPDRGPGAAWPAADARHAPQRRDRLPGMRRRDQRPRAPRPIPLPLLLHGEPMNAYHLRRYRPTDRDAVEAIDAACFADTLTAAQLDQLAGGRGIVAAIGDQVVGYCFYRDPAADPCPLPGVRIDAGAGDQQKLQIDALAVLEEHRPHGSDQMLAAMRTIGLPVCALVQADDEASTDLFRRNGFTALRYVRQAVGDAVLFCSTGRPEPTATRPTDPNGNPPR